MLRTMHSPQPNFSFDFSSPYRPAVPSPLSSSPIRASHVNTSQKSLSSPPLSPRNINTLPRRDLQSSPTGQPAVSKFKFASRPAKPNPLRQSREAAQEGRRRLFLKNVRQKRDDLSWERRGGDQEILKLEWSALDRKWRQEKDADLDGLLFEHDIDDIPELNELGQIGANTHADALPQPEDLMMVDEIAHEEEAELDAMLSMYEDQGLTQASSSRPPGLSAGPLSLSDDEDYDDIFQDLLSRQVGDDDIVLSGQMDTS